MSSKPDNEFLNNMSRDPGNWRGPFYFNKRDPRLLVPKMRMSLGWTLNFANPYSYVALSALIVVIIVIAIFSS